MTKISTVYDFLITTLATQYSGKLRIPNPYSLPDNPYQFLRDSYGLKAEGHFLQNQSFCDKIVQEYTYKIVLCREVIRMDTSVGEFDTTVKALEEDVLIIRKYLYDIDNIVIPDDVDQLILGATDPLGFFIGEKNNYVFYETSIAIRIRETY